jgi:hypothetical protein
VAVATCGPPNYIFVSDGTDGVLAAKANQSREAALTRSLKMKFWFAPVDNIKFNYNIYRGGFSLRVAVAAAASSSYLPSLWCRVSSLPAHAFRRNLHYTSITQPAWMNWLLVSLSLSSSLWCDVCMRLRRSSLLCCWRGDWLICDRI